jgi:hypothetical protein
VERLFDPRFALGYCMGLIVGEGSFSGDKQHPVLVVGLHAADPQPLLDLQSVFGGTIYGPYEHNGRVFRRWHLRGWQLLEALPYFDRWLPPSRKREQYEAWKIKYARYLARLTLFHVGKGPRLVAPRQKPAHLPVL